MPRRSRPIHCSSATTSADLPLAFEQPAGEVHAGEPAGPTGDQVAVVHDPRVDHLGPLLQPVQIDPVRRGRSSRDQPRGAQQESAGVDPREDEIVTEPITLAGLAAQASMSTRTLSRRFRAQTGTTPLQWLIRLRLARAQELLETTDLSVSQVASTAGFGSTLLLRQHFARALGTTPTAYRRTFNPPHQEAKGYLTS